MLHHLKRKREYYSKVSGHLTKCSVKCCNLHWIQYLITTIRCSSFFCEAFMTVMAKGELFIYSLYIHSQWANLYCGWWWPNWSQEKQFFHNLTPMLKVPKLTSSLVLCLCQQTNRWRLCISHVKAFSDVVLCPTKINTPRTTLNMTPRLENLHRITHLISRAFKINAQRRSHVSEFKINCDFKRFIKVLSKSSDRTWMWT